MKQIFNVLFGLLLTPICGKFYSSGDKNEYQYSSAFLQGSFIGDCANSLTTQASTEKSKNCQFDSSSEKLEQIYDFLIDTNTTASTNSIASDNSAFEMCLFPSEGIFFEKSTSILSKETMTSKVKSLLKNKEERNLSASMQYSNSGICLTAVVDNSCFKFADKLGLVFELSDFDVVSIVRNLEFKINDVPFVPFSVINNKFFNFKDIKSSDLEKVTLSVCSREFPNIKDRTFSVSMTENLNTFSVSYFIVAHIPYKPRISQNFLSIGTAQKYISFDIPFLIAQSSNVLAVISFDDEYRTKYKSILPLITVRATIDISNKGTTCRRMTTDTKYIIDSAFCQEVNNKQKIFLLFTNLPTYTRFPISSVKVSDLAYLVDVVDSNSFVPI